MGYRARCVLAAVAALSGAVWASGTANGDADTPRQHPGAVQDRFLKIPLEADVLAWEGTASPSTSDQGSCPQFGDKPIDSRHSAPDGHFAVQIQSSEQVYTLTYCKFGYFPRVDHNLPNDPDGTSVLPTPAQLWPQTPPDTDAANAAYDGLVRNYMVASLNELAYLRKINPERFKGLYKPVRRSHRQGRGWARRRRSLVRRPDRAMGQSQGGLSAAWYPARPDGPRYRRRRMKKGGHRAAL